MGTGGGDGFQWYPDFTTYALLLVFDNEKDLHEFEKSKIFSSYLKKSIKTRKFSLIPYEGHGLWDGKMPFHFTKQTLDAPVAVLTRAKIKWKYLHKFWSKVPKVSASLDAYKGRIFGKGVGEWPLVFQATFSVWESKEAVMEYAYKNPKHREVIKMTRDLSWYAEEMFCRFWVTDDSLLKQ